MASLGLPVATNKIDQTAIDNVQQPPDFSAIKNLLLEMLPPE